MVLDLFNKGGWEPIAGRKGQGELPGPRKKRRCRKREGDFSARLGKEKQETIMSNDHEREARTSGLCQWWIAKEAG